MEARIEQENAILLATNHANFTLIENSVSDIIRFDILVTTKILPHAQDTTYFDDRIRKIDFVLVYNKNKTAEEMKYLNIYLENAKRKGIEIERANSFNYPDIVFVKLHAPEKLLLDLANIYNIIFSYQNNRNLPRFRQKCKFLLTDILKPPNPYNPLFQRTSEIIKGQKTETITSAERILLINKLLAVVRFGPLPTDHGYKKLLKNNILSTAYPLHDGDWDWSNDEFINDRQILARYWANKKCWYKYQPIHVIQQYYGTEFAFYFTWLGYYTHSLVAPAVIGFLIFLYGLVTCGRVDAPRINEICNSTVMMCPTCTLEHCGTIPLRKSCSLSKVTYVFDNWATVVFAMLMTFWATCFIEFWKRTEAKYLFKWNLMTASEDFQVLPEFEENTDYRRVSEQTGKFEPYVPTRIKILNYTKSTTVCFCLILTILCGVFLVMLLRQALKYAFTLSNIAFFNQNRTIILLIICSIVSVIIIKRLQPLFNLVSLKLTLMENPRTRTELMNSMVIKKYILAFFNNYSPLFYLAFFKEKFFSHPGDEDQHSFLFGLKGEICHPSGCIIGVSIQLVFLMILKSFTGKFIAYVCPVFRKLFKKCKGHKTSEGIVLNSKNVPQWEKDYELVPVDDFFLINDFMELVLQYGMVTFFVASMPLAPLFALINNILELRLDAHKFLRTRRRPVPHKPPGLGAWNGIILAKTYFSTLCNALVIAFTSEFVPRELYRHRNGNLVGFVGYTMSTYNLSDGTQCHYRGHKVESYEDSEDYFYDLAMRFFVVVLFEHIVYCVTGILAYAIPDIPFSVRQKLTKEDHQLQRMRLKQLDEKRKRE